MIYRGFANLDPARLSLRDQMQPSFKIEGRRSKKLTQDAVARMGRFLSRHTPQGDRAVAWLESSGSFGVRVLGKWNGHVIKRDPTSGTPLMGVWTKV